MNPVRDNKNYYTYIIQSIKDKRWYTGFTYDLRKRFKEHNAGEVFQQKIEVLLSSFIMKCVEMSKMQRPERNI